MFIKSGVGELVSNLFKYKFNFNLKTESYKNSYKVHTVTKL